MTQPCAALDATRATSPLLGRVRQVARATATNRASMLQDVLRGVPTEIGVINEAIVREGRQLGVATPVNEVISTTIRAIEGSYAARVSQ